MHKAQAKRMAWLKIAELVEDESEDWELNTDKYSRHDQVRFEEAIYEVIEECYRRGEGRAPKRKPRKRPSDRDPDDEDEHEDDER